MIKRKIDNVLKLIFNPSYRFVALSGRGYYDHLSDEEHICRMFKAKMGYSLSLKNPQTYNEKLQWLKLYDRKPIYTIMVDKYEAKQYVASIIGKEYIIPTLGVWDSFDEIDFDALPNQFVLKCTHDSGGLVICKDKAKLNMTMARKKLTKSLKRNYYFVAREWPYKNVKPRIIAEKYLVDSSTSELRDYKVYTFNGKARLCMINKDRGRNTKADYFDRDYHLQDFVWGYEQANNPPEKPKNYELMFSLAEKLAAETIELRIDFYEVDGKVFFGELTFFDGGGFLRIEPFDWDRRLGDMIILPKG